MPRGISLRLRGDGRQHRRLSIAGGRDPEWDLHRATRRRLRTPAISVSSTAVFTNTLPTDAYRGAGRPEACYVLERLADVARGRSVWTGWKFGGATSSRSAMPYKTPIGPTYDCGDSQSFIALLALQTLRLPKRRSVAARSESGAASASRSSSNPRASRPHAWPARSGRGPGSSNPPQFASTTGSARAMLGTHNHGQGHATTFAQILLSRLGVPLARMKSWRAIPTRYRSAREHPGAFDRGRRLGARSRGGEDHRQGQVIAAHLSGGVGGRHPFPRWCIRGRRHRPARHTRRGVACGLCAGQLSSRGSRAWLAGYLNVRSAELRLEQRRTRLRGRSRPAGTR